jgi:hypothetical protein
MTFCLFVTKVGVFFNSDLKSEVEENYQEQLESHQCAIYPERPSELQAKLPKQTCY